MTLPTPPPIPGQGGGIGELKNQGFLKLLEHEYRIALRLRLSHANDSI